MLGSCIFRTSSFALYIRRLYIWNDIINSLRRFYQQGLLNEDMFKFSDIVEIHVENEETSDYRNETKVE